MTLNQVKQPDGGDLLDRLMSVTLPVVDAIVGQSGRKAADLTSIEVQAGDPILIRVVAGGEVFIGKPFGLPLLADTLGEFVTEGLNRSLTDEQRGKVADVMRNPAAVIVVRLEPMFGAAAAALAVPGRAPVELFTLQAGDVH